MSDFQANFAFSDEFRTHRHGVATQPERRLNAGQGLMLGVALGGFMWLAIGLTIYHYL